MESVKGDSCRKHGDLYTLLLKARLPLAAMVLGILMGLFLPAYIPSGIIAHEKIAPVQSVITEFSPDLQTALENIPIKTGNTVSAMARTVQFVPLKDVDIIVNPAFESYSASFQKELLTHEYLHIVQAEDSAIDIQAFHQAVQLWFNNFSSGLPVPAGNYTKYYLYFELYSAPRYSISDYPIEEYAYIGTMLAFGRQADIPANIRAYYRGILNGQ
jgi:hypothetical protein